VDYSVTELGKSLATAIKPVVLWGDQNETKVKNCQKKYASAWNSL
jgi:DNA-binding HxlR family transcriptional regulator